VGEAGKGLESTPKQLIRLFMDPLLIDLMKFRPRSAARALANRTHDEKLTFLQTWSLARLLAWAIVDQRPGKRPPNKQSHDSTKRKIRTAAAKQAGHIALGYLLDRRLLHRQAGSDVDSKTVGPMLNLFRECGGFAASSKGWGTKGLLYDIREANRELGYIYRIVDYMCRYDRYVDVKIKFDIESAKSFVELCAHEGKTTYGMSMISKIWEKYKNAAPYIFASYRFFSFRLRGKIAPDKVIDWLEKFTSDQERLTCLVGRAAHAADILAGKARNVRRGDFKGIDRVAPPMRPFSEEELNIISSIDRKAAIA
jgi:hypothetical protein